MSLLLLGLAIAVAGATVTIGTADGIGEGHDTSHYLSAATNLRAGEGVTVAFSSAFDPVDTATALDQYGRAPLTNYPPGYPAVLAATEIITPGGIGAAARVVGVITVALLAVSGFVLARALGAAPLSAAAIAWLAAFTPSALHLSMWAMSDALAAALTLAAIAAAAASVQRDDPTRGRIELLAGVLAAAAATTRYNGIAAAVAVLAIVVLTRGERRARWWASVRAFGPTAVVLVAGGVLAASRSTSPRPMAWHPPGSDDIEALVDVVGMWVVGAKSHTVIRIGAVVFVACTAAAGWLVARRTPARALTPRRAIALSIVLYAVAQLAIIVVTSALLDADVTADRRILVPVELLAVLLAAVCFSRLAPPAVALSAIAAFVVLRLSVPSGALPEGIGTPDMDHPPLQLYEMVSDLPGGTIVVANVPEALWRDARRPSIVAPARYDKLRGEEIPDLPGRLREMGRLVGERGGVLVLEEPRLFGVPVDSPRELNPSEVERDLPCAELRLEAAEGYIYDLAPCADATADSG